MAPDAAYHGRENGQFLLPYEAVADAGDPDARLMEFFQTTYEAAATLGDRDRASLEADPHRWDHQSR